MNKNIKTCSTNICNQTGESHLENEEYISFEGTPPYHYRCPRCHDQKLHKTISGANEHFQCHNCGGTWFGINELEKAIADKIKFNMPENVIPIEFNEHIPGPIKCPSCLVTMSNIQSFEIPDTKVSACMICQGRWLDGSQIALLQNRGLVKQLKNFVASFFSL